jgi:glycosyltransferase involved in cell wall biosynthesis
MNNKSPLVSVFMITYNHEKYIAQALNSVLMQKTSFDYEIVIGDDCSTDSTQKIIKDYVTKHPNKIKPIFQTVNVGAMRNAYEFTLPECKGKYIATLEGDDYWTDPDKLQKQVDFLESNENYSVCFHHVIMVDAQGKPKSR